MNLITDTKAPSQAYEQTAEQQQSDQAVLQKKIESLTQKLQLPHNSCDSITIHGHCIKHPEITNNVTLAELYALSTLQSDVSSQFIKDYDLQKSIDAINPYMPFFERLGRVAIQVLDEVSLFHLQLVGTTKPFDHSTVWYALIPDEAIVTIPISRLEQMPFCSAEIKILFLRLNLIQSSKPELLQQESKTAVKATWMWKTVDMSVGKLRSLSATTLTSLTFTLPRHACAFTSEEQLVAVNLAKFSNEQIDNFIRGDGSEETISQRFRRLSFEQFSIAIQRIALDLFRHLPLDCYRYFPLSHLSREQIVERFPAYINQENNRQRFQLIPIEEIAKSIKKLSHYHLGLISNEQISMNEKIRAIDYGALNSGELSAIFCSREYVDSTKSDRVALLLPSTINNILKKMPHNMVALLSPMQKESLNTAQLSRELVALFFPPHQPDTLYADYTHIMFEQNGKLYHRFESKAEHVASYHYLNYEHQQWQTLMGQRKQRCIDNFAIFSHPQMRSVKDKLSPEVGELYSNWRNSQSSQFHSFFHSSGI